jgi:hypothetical protein
VSYSLAAGSPSLSAPVGSPRALGGCKRRWSGFADAVTSLTSRRCVASAVQGSDELGDLLAKGWERFDMATNFASSGVLYIWLRWLGPAA